MDDETYEITILFFRRSHRVDSPVASSCHRARSAIALRQRRYAGTKKARVSQGETRAELPAHEGGRALVGKRLSPSKGRTHASRRAAAHRRIAPSTAAGEREAGPTSSRAPRRLGEIARRIDRDARVMHEGLGACADAAKPRGIQVEVDRGTHTGDVDPAQDCLWFAADEYEFGHPPKDERADSVPMDDPLRDPCGPALCHTREASSGHARVVTCPGALSQNGNTRRLEFRSVVFRERFISRGI